MSEFSTLSKFKTEDFAQIDKDQYPEPIDFEEYADQISLLIHHLSPVFDVDLNIYSKTTQKEIKALLERIVGLIDAVVNSKLTNTSSPADFHKMILDKINATQDIVFTKIALPLCMASSYKTSTIHLKEEADQFLKFIKSEQDQILKFRDELLNDSEKCIDAIREATANVGVAVNAQVFNNESVEHAKLAEQWLSKTYWFSASAILLAAAYLVAVFFYTPNSIGAAIQFISAKLILLSTLMFVVVWCSKNYKSHKHNETLNRHRANALNTFKTFYDSSSDPHVKDTILLHAANAAFTNRTTGYEAPHEKDSNPNTQVIDIFAKTAAPIAKASQKEHATQ